MLPVFVFGRWPDPVVLLVLQSFLGIDVAWRREVECWPVADNPDVSGHILTIFPPAVKMGFGVLRSRLEVRSCGGEGSCGVTGEYGVEWSSRVGVEFRS